MMVVVVVEVEEVEVVEEEVVTVLEVELMGAKVGCDAGTTDVSGSG